MARPVVKPWIFVSRDDAVLSFNAGGRSLFAGGPAEEDVVAVVIEVEGDIAKVIERAKSTPRRPNVIVLAAVSAGPGHDMSGMSGVVDGIVMRPADDTFEAWNAALQPILIGILYPDYEDKLDPAETQGGVTAEEFEETLRAAREEKL